jgi:hypothetical protein
LVFQIVDFSSVNDLKFTYVHLQFRKFFRGYTPDPHDEGGGKGGEGKGKEEKEREGRRRKGGEERGRKGGEGRRGKGGMGWGEPLRKQILATALFTTMIN